LKEAEAQLHELLEFNLRTTKHWYSAMTLAELGAVMRDQGRFAEARQSLEQGWHELAKYTGVPAAQQWWVLAQLVSLYELWHAAEPGEGYDARAAEWRVRLAALRGESGAAPTQPARASTAP
jgi:hypothetical protein